MKNRRGLSLLELLIAAAIGSGLIVLGGMILSSSIRSYENINQRVAQESVRNIIRTALDCSTTMAAISPWTPGSSAALRGKVKTIIASPSQTTMAGEVRVTQDADVGRFKVELRKENASTWQPLFDVPLSCI